MHASLSSYPRAVQAGVRVRHIGSDEAKSHWFDHVFSGTAAMFVIRGSGRLRRLGEDYKLVAPFVLLARPGGRYAYGPDESWNELHIIFEQAPAEAAEASTYPTFWPMRAPTIVQTQMGQMAHLCERAALPGVADQIDLLAHLMLVTSFHGTGEDIPNSATLRIYEAEQWMRTHLAENLSTREVAERFAFSPANFRRHWHRCFARSPWQHVVELRMQEARRLLEMSPGASVAQVARRCGYPNQRYFATAFRKHCGLSPREFRRTGRVFARPVPTR
jgi:AraC-like DNA-binding protein